MAMIQIRDILDQVFDVIRQRARTIGQFIRTHVLDWVKDLDARPTVSDVMDTLDEVLTKSNFPGATHTSIRADLAADRR